MKASKFFLTTLFAAAAMSAAPAFAADLTWAGTSDSNDWDTASANWTGESSTFTSGDNVTFDASATEKTVDVAENISAGTITVSDDYAFTTSIANGATVSASGLTVGSDATLTVNSGVTVNLSGTATAGFSVAGALAGSGTLSLALTSAWANVINLGTGNTFAGTVNVTLGYFTLNTSDIGSGTYSLDNGVNMQVTASGATNANDFIFNGTTQLHVNSGTSLTLTGTLSGDGTLNKRAAGALTVMGDVELSGFSSSDGQGSTTFSGVSTTIDTVTVSQGTVNFSGVTTTLETLTKTGGTLSFSSTTTTIDSATLSSGTTTFSDTTTNITTATVGATATFSGTTTNIGTLTMTLSSSVVNFTGTTVNITTLTSDNNGGATKTLTIGANTDVTVGTFTVNRSIGNFVVDGALTVTGNMSFSTLDVPNNITGAGSLTVEGTLTVSGGTVNFSSAETDIGTATLGGSGTVTFSGDTTVDSNVVVTGAGAITFEGENTTIGGTLYLSGADTDVTFSGTNVSIGTITTSPVSGAGTSGVNKSLTIAEGTTVTASSFTNGWGLGTLTVDGTLNVTGQFRYATGNTAGSGISTVTGTGTINAGSLSLDNQGTYVFGSDGNNPTLNVSGATSIGDTSYSGTVSATFNGETTMNSLSVFKNSTVTFNGKTTITGEVDVGTSSNALNGTVNFNGETTIGSLHQRGGTINLGSSDAADDSSFVVVTTEQYIGAAHGQNAGTLNINKNAVFNVTGTNNDNATDFAASFQISRWNATSTLNVAGVLNVASQVTAWGGNGVINITDGGEANFSSGLIFSDYNAGNSLTVTLSDGGRINVGSSSFNSVANNGIGTNSTLTLNLNGGTIGSLADSWSSTNAIALGGAVTIDTEKRTVSSEGKSTAAGTGSDITLSGVISGAGSLTLDGLGSLTLGGANTYSGGTTVSAGTLVATNASALGTGAVSVADGATLENAVGNTLTLSGGLTTASGAILVIDNASAFSESYAFALGTGENVTTSVSAGTIFNLIDLGDSTTVNLISGAVSVSDGNVSSMGLGNLLIDDGLANQRGSASFTLSEGNLTLVYEEGANYTMTWDGGATQESVSGLWVADGEGWTGQDAAGNALAGTDANFQNGDSVIFGADADVLSVTLSGVIIVDEMTVADVYTFDGQNDATLKFGTLAGTFEKSGEGALTLSGGTVSETAGIVVSGGDANLTDISFSAGSSLAVSDGDVIFSGGSLAASTALTLSGGSLLLDGVSFTAAGDGETVEGITLSGGSLAFSAATTLSRNLVASDGTTSTLDASNGTLTVSGTVTGAGTVNLTGGTVVLSNSGLNFEGTLVVDTGATLNFGNDGSSTEITVANITVNESGTVSLPGWSSSLNFSTLTMKGGSTLNFTNGNRQVTDSHIGTTESKIVVDAAGSSVTLAGSSYGTSTNIHGTILGTGTLNLAQYGGTNAWSVSAAIQDGTNTGDVLALTVNLNSGQQVTLSGANTYTGGTTINSGTILANNATALGSGTVSVASGAILTQGTTALTLGGLSGAGTVNYSGTDAGTLTVNSAEDETFSGSITGDNLSLVKDGAGTLTLGSTNAVSYGGSTTIEEGTLQLGYTGTWDKPLSGTGTLGIASDSTITWTAGTQADFTGTLDVAGAFSVQEDNDAVAFSLSALNGAGSISGTEAARGLEISADSGTFSGTLTDLALVKTNNADAANNTLNLSGAKLSGVEISSEGGIISGLNLTEGNTLTLSVSTDAGAADVVLSDLTLSSGTIAWEELSTKSTNIYIDSLDADSIGGVWELVGLEKDSTYYLAYVAEDAKTVLEDLFAAGAITGVGAGTLVFSDSADANGYYTLTFTKNEDNKTVYWTANTGDWYSGSTTWVTATGDATTFVDEDDVVFDNAHCARYPYSAVSVGENGAENPKTLVASSMTVDLNEGYVLHLTVWDNWTLRLTDAAGVTVNGGTLLWDVGNDDDLDYAGAFTLNAGGALNIYNVTDGHAVVMANTVSGAGTLQFGERPAGYDGDLPYISSGTLTLNGDRSTFTGTLSVGNGATVILDKYVAGTETARDERFAIAVAEDSTVQVNAPTGFVSGTTTDGYNTAYSGNTLTLSGALSGAGTIAVVGTQTGDFSGTNGTTLTLSGDRSTFTGTLALRDIDVILAEDENFAGLGGASDFGDGALTVSLEHAALNFLNGAVVFSKNIAVGENNVGYIRVYGNNTGATLSGDISGAGTLTVQDGGKAIFSGEIDLGAFVSNSSSVEINNAITAGTFTAVGGTVSISGPADISGAFTTTNSTVSITGTRFAADSATFTGGEGNTVLIRANTTNITNALTISSRGAKIGGTVTIGGNLEYHPGDDAVPPPISDPTNISAGFVLEFLENADVDIAGTFSTQNADAIALGANATVNAASFENLWSMWLDLGEGSALTTGTMTLNSVAARESAISGTGTLDVGSLNISGGSLDVRGITLLVGTEGITGTSEASLLTFGGGLTVGVRGDATFWSSSLGISLNGATIFNVDDEKSITLSGAIGDDTENGETVAGSLTKTGAGTLTLNQINMNTGGTTVAAGTLEYAIAGGSNFARDVSVEAGAILKFAVSDDTAGTIALGDATIALEDETAYLVAGANTTLDVGSAIVFDGDTLSYYNEAASGSLLFSANYAFAANETLNLLSVSNTGARVSIAAGATLSVDGTLAMNTLGTTGQSTIVSGAGTLALGDGARVYVNNGALNNRFGNTTGDDRVTVSLAGAATFEVVGTAGLTVSGALSGNAEAALEKTGTGTLTIDQDTANGFSGSITVSAGTLSANGGTYSQFKDLTVSGSSATFSGSVADTAENAHVVSLDQGGRFVGDVSLSNADSHFSADAATLTGNLTLSGGANATIVAGSTVTGQISLSGGASANIDASTLSGGLTANGASLTIGSTSVGGNVSLTDTELTLSGTFSGIGNLAWGDGNSIALTDSFKQQITGTTTLIDFTSSNITASTDLSGVLVDDTFVVLGRREQELVYNAANTSIDIQTSGVLSWTADVTSWVNNNADLNQWELDGISETAESYFQTNDYVVFESENMVSQTATLSIGEKTITTSGLVFDLGSGTTFTLTSSLEEDKDDPEAEISTIAGADRNAGLSVYSGTVVLADDVRLSMSGNESSDHGVSIYAGTLQLNGDGSQLAGDGKILLGNTTSTSGATQAATLAFTARDGEITVSQQLEIGNAMARISVSGSDVTFTNALTRAEDATSAALTKTGAGTLNIQRDSDLDQLTVAQGEVVLLGDSDTTLGVANVVIGSTSSAGTLVVSNTPAESEDEGFVPDETGAHTAFGSISFVGTNGSSLVVEAGAFRADTVSAAVNGSISGTLAIVGGDDGTTEFNVASGATLTFTGDTIAIDETDEARAILEKTGAGTLVLQGANNTAFVLCADVEQAGGTMEFASGLSAADRNYAVSENGVLSVGGSSDSTLGALSVADSATFQIALASRNALNVSSIDLGAGSVLLLSRDNGNFVVNTETFTAEADSVLFVGELTSARPNYYGTLSVTESFAAGTVAIGSRSTLDLSAATGDLTANVLYVGNNGASAFASTLNLGGNTLSVGGENYAALYANNEGAALKVVGNSAADRGTLQVTESFGLDNFTSGVYALSILLDNANFEFNVGGATDTIYTSLSGISTVAGSTGSVVKTGAGTLSIGSMTGASNLTFDGDIRLDEGTTALYATVADADLTIGSGATLDFYGTAKISSESVSVDLPGLGLSVDTALSASLTSAGGRLNVRGVLVADTAMSEFSGTLAALGGTLLVGDAFSDWQANNAANVLELGEDGVILGYEDTATLQNVSLTGDGTLYGYEGVIRAVERRDIFTVKNVSAAAGTTLTLAGYGHLENYVGATDETVSAENKISVEGTWLMSGTSENLDAIEMRENSYLSVNSAGALGDAAVSVGIDATLSFETAGTYGNAITVSGGEVSVSGSVNEHANVTLTNVGVSGGDATFSADYATLTLNQDVLALSGDETVWFEAGLGTDSTAKIVIDVNSDVTVGENVFARGAGTLEFDVAEGATVDAAAFGTGTYFAYINTLAVSGAGTFELGADSFLVSVYGDGQVSVAENATLSVDGTDLSSYTLTGAGTANISGSASFAGIEDATNVSLTGGTLSVGGNVSGSKIAFADAATLAFSGTVSATTLSGETVALTSLGASAEVAVTTTLENTTSLTLGGSTGTTGTLSADYSGSLTKNGAGTWTVSDFTLEDALAVSAGTLIWQNAAIAADNAAVTVDGTLRIASLAGEDAALSGTIGGSGTLEIATGASAEIELNVSAAENATWRLNVSNQSVVSLGEDLVLPGNLNVSGASTVNIAVADGEEKDFENAVTLTGGSRLVKTGAGTLALSNDNSRADGTSSISVAEGTVRQTGNILYVSGATIAIADGATFETAFGADLADSVTVSAKLTGTGTFSVAETANGNVILAGDLSAFAGTLDFQTDTATTLSGTMFGESVQRVNVDGALTLVSQTGGALNNVSGSGEILINASTGGSNFRGAVYTFSEATGEEFDGTISVLSGALSLTTAQLADLNAEIDVGGTTAATYGEYRTAGMLSGGFLRVVHDGTDDYDVASLFSADNLSFGANAGLIFAGTGTYAATQDFGAQMNALESGATLEVARGVKIGGSVFIASGSTLEVNTPSDSATANTAIDGDLTVNGTLICNVSDASFGSAQVSVAGTATLNTAAGTQPAEIVLDTSALENASLVSGSTDLVIVNAANLSYSGDLDNVLSVTDTNGTRYEVSRDGNGNIVLVSKGNDYANAVPSSLSELYAVIKDDGGDLWTYLKQDRANRAEMDRKLVALSPVSFGALAEMQSGFAAIENDLLRERLEQRRYERAFASDRTTQIKPFVNVFGSTRESGGNGIDAANYDITHYGALGGFDFAVSPNTILGFSVGLDWAKAKTNDNGGENTADTSRFGVYGMSTFANAYAGFGLSFGGTSFDTERRSGYNREVLKGETDGNDVNLSLLAGLGWVVDKERGIDIAPFVGFDIGYANVSSWTETGGASALDVDGFDRWSLRGKIGAAINWRATENLRFGLELLFAHEFLDTDIDIDAKFAAGSPAGAFTSTAYLMDENTVQIGPRVDFRIDDTWSINAAYAFEADFDETTTHSANIGIRARF